MTEKNVQLIILAVVILTFAVTGASFATTEKAAAFGILAALGSILAFVHINWDKL